MQVIVELGCLARQWKDSLWWKIGIMKKTFEKKYLTVAEFLETSSVVVCQLW
jgi:hypothetical protein